MRILFAGTPEIAVPSLKLLHARHDICGVLTNPDRPSGRGRKLAPSPVKAAAQSLEIPVLQPERLVKEAREAVAALEPELLVVVAFSRIFGPKFLSLFPRGGINMHPSILPKYRGPSPINAAILNGDEETGITVQQLALKMDAGDIIAQVTFPLNGSETAETLAEECAEKGSSLLLEAVDCIENGTAVPRSQEHEKATYCSLLNKEDGLIDWSRSAEELDRQVRGLYPWPGTFTYFESRKLKIISVKRFPGDNAVPGDRIPGTVLGMDKNHGILIQTGQGILGVTCLQLQSKKAMDHFSFMNGLKDFTGAVLGGNEC